MVPSSIPLTHISVRRTLKGSSQSRGRLAVSITNNMPISIQTSYLESMPWLLQFYLHSLQVHLNGVSRGEFVSTRYTHKHKTRSRANTFYADI